jgi:hypothetical protein
MGAHVHVLLPLAVNSKSERKVDSLLPLEFEPVTFGMLAYLSDRSAKFHPLYKRFRDSLFNMRRTCTALF